MRIGESWDVVAWQDWDSVSKLEVPKKLIEYHSEEEVNKLLDACPTLDGKQSYAWRQMLDCGAKKLWTFVGKMWKQTIT